MSVTVNGRSYKDPKKPVVIVCVDGSEPGYIERAAEAGVAPFLGRLQKEGTSEIADCAAHHCFHRYPLSAAD